MNENIKQLQNTAGIQVVRTLMRGDENTEVKLMLTQTQLDRFAELIVRECAAICEKDGRWWAEKGYLMEAGEAGSLATQIKQHFGVEE